MFLKKITSLKFQNVFITGGSSKMTLKSCVIFPFPVSLPANKSCPLKALETSNENIAGS